ncbi:MAG: TRAP transporter small permease subunit [Planctomycetaceae bacterium]|nr:TRAP transporter small permease subunit [Planctomycetaceae bacterium]
METFIKAVDSFTNVIGKVLALLIIPMIAVVLYTAVMRYWFKTSVPWGFEMALFIFGIYCIGGGAFAHLHKSHVNVDVLTSHLPPTGRALMEIFGQLVILSVLAVTIYLGSLWAYKSTVILERSIHGTEWNPQIWWFKWFVPFSAVLFALQCSAELLKQVVFLRQKKRG